MKSLDGLILKLDIPKQKPLKKVDVEKPDLSKYPIEYRYLDRILYRLGSLFYGYKFADLPNGTLDEAIVYALSGSLKLNMNNRSKKNVKGLVDHPKNHQDYCQKLGINMLVVGPDLDDFRFVWHGKKMSSDNLEKPFMVLLRSYEGLHYPLVNLAEDQSKPDLFMHRDSKLIQEYVTKLEN
jgi:hypothetical protein